MTIFQIDFLTLWLMSLSLVARASAAPKPDANGLCASYIIQGYDTCASIAKAHSITEADIEKFNANTWFWLGCQQLYQGDFICLSPGSPPMPMALPQATCGPQVPGTVRPAKWKDLAGLNPCPAPQCCTWWGACSKTKSVCAAAARAPPAGETATIKAPTKPPKTTAARATGAKTAKTTAKTTAKPVTTKAGTKTQTAKASKATASKTTKKSPAKPTAKMSSGDSDWNAPWELTVYSKQNCTGDYYHMEGYNDRYNDTLAGCHKIHGGLNSKWTEDGLTCKWWKGGFEWAPCDKGPILKPQSWIVKNGFCGAFQTKTCSCYDHDVAHLSAQGCQNRLSWHPNKLNAFMCAKKFK